MSGYRPPIAVRDILSMDAGAKTRTADEYCRVEGITDPERRYQGHTRWMTWNELDEFYWNPQRGVATAWRESLAAKGKQREMEPVKASPFDSFTRSKANLSGPPKKFVKLGRRRDDDSELFVPMDTTT
jgi:hypothetical protein